MTIQLEKSTPEIIKDKDNIIKKLVQFSHTDTLLFWGENKNLLDRQKKLWKPILSWAQEYLNIKYNTTQGIDIPKQEDNSESQLTKFLENLTPKELTGFYYAALNMRSTLLAAAFIKQKISAEKAHQASCLEELWQAEQWGIDTAAENRRQNLLQELKEIETFIK